VTATLSLHDALQIYAAILTYHGIFLYQYPTMLAPMAIIPSSADIMMNVTSNAFVSIINICGWSTNIYGMMNAAMANLTAFPPVRIGSPPDIPVAAKAARATGGVISATIPK